MDKKFYLENQGFLSDKEPNKELFTQATCNDKDYPKVFGGLWTSTIINNCNTSWINYVKEFLTTKYKNPSLYKITISEKAKVLTVDLDSLTNGNLDNYIVETGCKIMSHKLDIEKILKDGYDIIHYTDNINLPGTCGGNSTVFYLREKGASKDILSKLSVLNSICSGLDCEDCSVILNYDIIEKYEKVEDFEYGIDSDKVVDDFVNLINSLFPNREIKRRDK